ncbi:hypothetical protein TNCV_4014681 [Trichonephila clavipes]|uniref:Uncharacterized protein n=1 Tax=Trichonephila clavipes TaxID=2585209 RepID=A0A8X6RIG7_TRICX|nr:hypothetical protein TNCV_4014681 [Trichonephila clavipes]
MGPLIHMGERLKAQGYSSVISDHVHPVMLMVLTPCKSIFNRRMLPVTQLKLFENNSKSMPETLPCKVGPHNQQISFQLRICGMR